MLQRVAFAVAGTQVEAILHLPDGETIGGAPVLAGRGAVSFIDAVNALRRLAYDGYISFEWEKYWHPEIEEPEVALPDFVKAMKAAMTGFFDA